MIYDIVVYIIIMVVIVGLWRIFIANKPKQHNWYEVDSSDIAHSHRLSKKKEKK